MGRRKTNSAGMGILIVLGLTFWALSAAYHFIQQNAAAIAVGAIVFGLVLLIWSIFSRTGSKGALPPSFPRDVSVTATVAQGTQSKRVPARWIVPSEAVAVQGAQISGGLFYLGDFLRLPDGRSTDQYVINPKLSASAARPDAEGASMPYWPSYAGITPAARRAFLNWMAEGRNGRTYGVGHAFLFFYALEHRAFVDTDPTSLPALIQEVERLLTVYGDNNSFRGYATRFLSCARIAAGIPVLPPKPSPERTFSSEPDVAIRLRLGLALQQDGALGPDDALLWALALPDVHLRTPAVRCFEEFERLFRHRFSERYPSGLALRATGNIRLNYKAASGAFEVSIPGSHERYPDICQASGRAPADLKTIVQECTDELDSFSRFVGRRPEARESMQAALLLPEPLQRDPADGRIHLFGQKMHRSMGEHKRASTKMRNMLEAAGFDMPANGKVTPALADQLGSVLDCIDIAIEPDRRYGSGVPQLDDQVIIFKADGGGKVDPDRSSYRAVKIQVEVAVLAAAADGDASTDEMKRVIAGVREAADLTPIEQARLIAYAVTVFNSPPKQDRVMRKLGERSPEERTIIADAALAVIAGNDSVDPSEVRFLERLHKALGLPKERVYSGLHRASPPQAADEPVAISQEVRTAGIPIPASEKAPTPVAAVKPVPETAPASTIRIDAVRLARTQRETQTVAALLANIFEEDAPSPAEPAPAAPDTIGSFAGLDAGHAELLELLEIKGSLPRAEFDQRAKDLKLLPDGAIERINDWAFDRFEEAIIEDGEDVVMIEHLRERLAQLREAA
ncbi:TerB N-terminal domain-containing protein [Bradyrhizobium sp. 166]|uniref:tellurite resistance TerB family protein n=1 Tax=Bradyrhizobium sp. 166 TaxID=2782638 RepID=UPI001FF7F902|nr:TerB N-terminal domain-containing protein [Bradyrhizobium sp. 166]MCK1603469.1 TerB N-terminal domain-containing protein [Bradyrhizobium sp. 166]